MPQPTFSGLALASRGQVKVFTPMILMPGKFNVAGGESFA
jgi:hypothetical protein